MPEIVVAVDFDGTCVYHDWPRVGRDIGAVPVLRKMVKAGMKIILCTMRGDMATDLGDAVGWFNDNGIPLYGINEHPTQSNWTSSQKPYANIYIDDAALGCPLFRPEGGRPYVDWKQVDKLLFNGDPIDIRNTEVYTNEA
jgi:hypothetical protein